MDGPVKRVVYVDMDGVLVDFASGLARVPDETRREYEGHEDDIPGVFALMEPMPGAVDAFQELSSLYDVYVLSTAPWKNPSAWSDKLVWVQQHLGEAARKRLILTHHKDLNLGEFLVDDRTKHGVDEFLGHHIHFGSERFPGWPAILEYLRVAGSPVTPFT